MQISNLFLGCGSCTVSLTNEKNLKPVSIYSCTTKLWTLHGASITTIEGLPDTSPLHKALVKNHGVQCGFCSPGMVMSAYCHQPDLDIEDCLKGNLCRCTGYRPILEGFQQLNNYQLNERSHNSKSPVTQSLEFSFNNQRYFVPMTLTEVRYIQSRFETVEYLQGGTGWYQIPDKITRSQCVVYLGRVQELNFWNFLIGNWC